MRTFHRPMCSAWFAALAATMLFTPPPGQPLSSASTACLR